MSDTSNSVFTNKYGKIRCWPRNYQYLGEFTNIFSPILYYSLIFSLLQISIGLSVFGFIANEYKQITIRSLSTIRYIQSGIRWAKPKVFLNYSTLPISDILAYLLEALVTNKKIVLLFLINTLLKFSSVSLMYLTNKLERLPLARISSIFSSQRQTF